MWNLKEDDMKGKEILQLDMRTEIRGDRVLRLVKNKRGIYDQNMLQILQLNIL